MHLFHNNPVGLTGLAALGLGFILFLVGLLSAQIRGRRSGADQGTGRRASASITWIIVQGIGIGIAGFGRIDATLDPLSTTAIAQGAVVLMLMIGTVVLFDSSSRTMGKNWALVARTRSDATLVTSGPFAWVRNPIYVALGMFMLAMAIAYGHTANLIVAVPIFAIGTWMRVRYEEQVLRAEFGPAYDAYAARVKRFIPGIF
jgi:protein-S-isoprenylcysteine O-methyltransferase Ste14